MTMVDAEGVKVGDERIAAQTVLWAAGVAASPLARSLGAPLDRVGRVLTEPTLAVPGHPEIFVVGDLASLQQDGRPLPGVAQVAMQGGAHAARNILRAIRGEPLRPFRYRDYGNVAVIGRGSAVVDIGPVKASGFFAWVFWLFLHIFWLIGFRNRLAVLVEWAWSYVTMQRGVRLITGERLWPRHECRIYRTTRYNIRPSRLSPNMRAVVLALADLGRSARMQYHARALAANGVEVDFVGYEGTPLPRAIADDPRYHRSSARRRRRCASRAVGGRLRLVAVFDTLRLSFRLWRTLRTLPRPDLVLVQNPPAFPTLAVTWFSLQRRGVRFVDRLAQPRVHGAASAPRALASGGAAGALVRAARCAARRRATLRVARRWRRFSRADSA